MGELRRDPLSLCVSESLIQASRMMNPYIKSKILDFGEDRNLNMPLCLTLSSMTLEPQVSSP